nr:SagB family peptide dehydrogenase [Amycolatopsis rubida]
MWSLSEDALLEVDAAGAALLVVTRWGEFDVSDADGPARELLRRMELGPVFLGNVTGIVPGGREPGTAVAGREGGGPAGFERVLDRVSGAVVHSLGLANGRRPLLSAIPVVASPVFAPRRIGPLRKARLSRFAALRSADDALVLESPRADFRVVLTQPAAAQVAASLAAPATAAEIAERVASPVSVVADIVGYLVAAGVVLAAGRDRGFAEDADPVLRPWSHHELLFHVRSRMRPPELAAEPPAGEPPPETEEPAGAAGAYPLRRPEAGGLPADRRPLAELLEQDHVWPELPGASISAGQLGELLFRSARVRSAGPAHPRFGRGLRTSQRPYFAVAGLYELELYLSIEGCAGLPDGIHRYDPVGHALTVVSTDAAARRELLDMAKAAAGSARRPSALITVTVRIGRMSRVLGGAAYAIALMHLGALQQTLYLVARAMGVIAHAVPVDASDRVDRVDRVLRLRWPAEVSVGECVLAGRS